MYFIQFCETRNGRIVPRFFELKKSFPDDFFKNTPKNWSITEENLQYKRCMTCEETLPHIDQHDTCVLCAKVVTSKGFKKLMFYRPNYLILGIFENEINL